MSLFKLKSLWSKFFQGQQFDQKHLSVGSIERQPTIALGNFQGTLTLFQIYKSQQIQLTTIYQNKFQTPIIAIQFVAHPDQRVKSNTVGALLFKKFAFVTLQYSGKNTYQGKILYIQVEPSFGIGISPLSIMTLNSSIQALNPREIQKIKVADPIYPFTRLLNRLYFMDGQELVEIEGSTQQWRIIVGRVRQLFAFVDTIVAVGERALWEVSQAKIVKTKVLEDEISCGAIAFRNNNTYNILIANFSAQLFVYSSNYELLWALKLDYAPIKIVVCQHSDIKGMLILLSDEGNLQLGYSGVEVSEHVVQPLSQKIDLGLVQHQTQAFLERMNSKGEEHKKAEQAINIQGGYRLYFSNLQKSFQIHDEKHRLFQIQGKLVKFQLICEVTSRQGLRNFKVQINTAYNLHSDDQIKQLRVAKNKDTVAFNLYASNQSYPYQHQISVIVRYESNQQKGPPFIRNQTLHIPMALQCLVSGYQAKDNFPNKLIVKSNTQLPSFNQIFPELFAKDSQQQRKSLKFTLANGVDCVIGYNKGFNKAKIQSPYYSGLCYIIGEFSNHIRMYNARANAKIQLSVQIPLQQFFTIMKQHYQHRIVVKQAFADVQAKSQQFRNTQKKLLIKMKEKMSNLGSIDKLLEFTYDRLIQSATKYEQVTKEMDIINHNLCVAITLIIELLFIRSNPSQKAKNIALGILGYEKESLERGWQDKVIANSSHFLNKKYNKADRVSYEQLQKIPLYVISKVNNGEWN